MPKPAKTTSPESDVSLGKFDVASGAWKLSAGLPSRAKVSDVSWRSGVYSMSGTGGRKESPAAGFRPALANSLAIHWTAASEPRERERRPSRASEERNVRSAFSSEGRIES